MKRFLIIFLSVLASTLAMSVLLIPMSHANAAGPATILASVAVGSHPKGVAVNEQTNRVYVALNGTNQVVMLGGDANLLATQPTNGSGANLIAYDAGNGRVFVTNRDSKDVSILDGSTLAFLGKVIVGKMPWGVAADPQTNEVYVGNFGSGTMSDVNGDTATLISNTILPPNANAPAEQPALATFDSNTGRLYLGGWQTGNVYIMPRSKQISNTLYAGQGVFGIAYAPDGVRVYTTNRLSGKLIVSDCTGTDAVGCGKVQNVQLPSAYAIAFNPHTNHLFVVGETGGGEVVYVINSQTYQTLQTIALGTANADDGGQGIALNHTTDRVYVTNYADGKLTVIQDAPDFPVPTPTPTVPFHPGAYVLTTIPVGTHPKSGAFETVRDRELYVTLFDSSKVQVIDEDDYSLRNLIDVQGLHPNQITLGDKFYVTNRDSNSLSAIYLLGPLGVACRGATGVQPFGVAYNPANKHVYTANFGPSNGNGSISVFDTGCNLLKTINLKGDRPTMMAVLNGKVFVPGWLKGNLYVIDSSDNLTSQISVGAGAFGIAAYGNSVYMTNRNNHLLYTMDASGTDIQYIITLPGAGYAMAVNPNLSYLYIVGAENDQLYQVYTTYNVYWGSLPVGHQDSENGGQGIVAHPRTNRVYVMNYADGTITVIQDVSGPGPKPPLCYGAALIPILGSPANGSTVAQKAVRLDWARTGCAQTYDVQVKQDSTNGTKVDSGSGLTQTLFTTKALVPGKTYYWRARGCSTSTGCAAWSSWSRLTVANNAK